MRNKLPVLCGLLFLMISPVFALEGPRVTGFTPQGTVKKVRQVRASFSAPMVAFGDPVAPDPFAVECPEPGRGRWVDSRNWVYDFERDLPAGVRGTFRMRPGLKSLGGPALSGQRDFVFNTGGPAISLALPGEGSRNVAEDQAFILALDAAPDEASVLAHAGFVISGIKERVGVEILAGAEREALLAAQRWLRERVPDQSRIVVIKCRQAFPVKSKVSLVWGKGIQTASGAIANAQDQVLHFESREPFLAEFSCERENPRAGCIPMLPMSLRFNAPLAPDFTGEAVLKGPGGKTWKLLIKPDTASVGFEGPFPENAEFELEIPAGIRDDAGRGLENAGRFPLKVRTAGLPPLVKFNARFGIIELKADPALPVTLRNVEPQVKAKLLPVAGAEGEAGPQVSGKLLNLAGAKAAEVPAWLRKVAAATRETSLFAGVKEARAFEVPKPLGGRAFEVVGIPLKKPGLYIVELESALLGRSLLKSRKPMYVPAAALVTNLAVHFKQGRESSLAWVTALDSGRPVAGAAVSVHNCEGNLLWEGRSDAEGVARIEAALPAENTLPGCSYDTDWMDYSQLGALSDLSSGLFVMAQSGEDFSFVHSSWDEGIEPWQFKLPPAPAAGAVIAHTVFDRALLRAGETLHMKHFVRRHTRGGFADLEAGQLPQAALIMHRGSDQSYRLPLVWDDGGVAESVWAIPKGARLGSYAVTLIAGKDGAGAEGRTENEPAEAEAEGEPDEEGPGRWESGGFRVEEFRVPLLKGTIQPPAAPLVNASEAALDLSVQYLAGGGASRLPVTVRSQTAPRSLPAFAGFEGFVFGNGGVAEGVVRRAEAEEEAEAAPAGRAAARSVELVLDAAGTGRAVVAGLKPSDRPQELTAEMEFRDPNGEVQTVSGRIPLWPSAVVAGVSPDGWALSKAALKFNTAVLDLAGRPAPGAPVKVELFERRHYSHRKRLVGGFYAYDHATEIRRVKTLCEGKADAGGRFTCEGASPLAGQLIVAVESRDAAGNRARTHREVWVAGRDDWWFEPSDHDRMDLIPERSRYEPGETAVFQVRMPFREATVLISVEREGVLETWTRRLSGRSPVVEVPILGNYAPNVYVSVLAVRGRVAEPQPTALVDLGKPAYKLGLAAINVGWRAHELKVNVGTDKAVYTVRDKAQVSIKVTTAAGAAPPPGSEVALAAVDEGLLELMANRSWELLPAMMGRRAMEVETATAQMHVVGKRHYGLKALPQGGGGGRQSTRELFDTLLLWKGRIALDAAGEARVEVPLNDAITSFRLTAVASSGAGLFGTGAASIRATRDLMVFSGLPPMVRSGDRFRAGVTVRNTTERRLELKAEARPAGIEPAPAALALALAPGEAREIGWDVTAPAGVSELPWEIEIKNGEGAGAARDRIRVTQKVIPAVPVRVLQATLAQLDPEIALPVERPPAALAGGGVRVEARPQIAAGLDAVASYMQRYPYTCFEQKTSAAVALRDKARWDSLSAELPAYLDADGLVKYFPSMTLGDPVLTAYVIAVTHAAGWSVPAEPLARMRAGLTRFVDGALMRYSPLPTADLALRKLAAIEALSRIGAAEAKMLSAIVIEPNLWPTSAVIDWTNILLNLEGFPQRGARLTEAEQILRTRLNFAGSVMGFSTEATDALWWLMVSNDLNAVRFVLTALRLGGFKEDLPRLVRGALARQRRGHWDLTTANAWGTLAMAKFSDRFESEKVTGATRAALAEASRAFDWSSAPEGGSDLLPWPAGRSEIKVNHQGTGKPWVTVQSLAAIPLSQPVSNGYRIGRTVTALERKAAGKWSRGDILRVRLDIEARADMSWVVVSDPVPAGSAVLGTGLGRDSALAVQGEVHRGRTWPAFEERSFEAFRAYYAWAPKGTWTLEYTLRLNQDGNLQLPPTRVEAMYAPEMYGELPNAVMVVEP